MKDNKLTVLKICLLTSSKHPAEKCNDTHNLTNTKDNLEFK